MPLYEKDGRFTVTCPKCKRDQPLYVKSDELPTGGFGGPYSIDDAFTLKPDFVCMAHEFHGGAMCDFFEPVYLVPQEEK